MMRLLVLCVVLGVAAAGPIVSQDDDDVRRELLTRYIRYLSATGQDNDLRRLAQVIQEDKRGDMTLEHRQTARDVARGRRAIYMARVVKGVIKVWPQIYTNMDTCDDDKNYDDCWFRLRLFDSAGNMLDEQWIVKSTHAQWRETNGRYEVESCRVMGAGSNQILFDQCNRRYCTVNGVSDSNCSSRRTGTSANDFWWSG